MDNKALKKITTWQFCPHKVAIGHTSYKLLSVLTTCVLGMAINASPLPRAFQNPLQKNSSWQQLLKGSTECAGINSLHWKILLPQFFPWLQIGGHHADNSADQEVLHPLKQGNSAGQKPSAPAKLGMDPVYIQGTRTEHPWQNRDSKSEMGGKKGGLIHWQATTSAGLWHRRFTLTIPAIVLISSNSQF